MLEQYIDFTERKFIEANAYSVLCFALWVLLPHLQFRYKLLSRFVGNDEAKACDFLSYVLIYTGTVRNHYINEAINNNIHITYGIWEYPILLLSTIAMAFGLVLICFSFYRLGLRGMYFGDHFGFLFKEKIVQFPYNYFDNAQYVGTTAFFIGYSLFFHSPAGIFITLVINILYKILTFVEDRKLKIFYPDAVKAN